MTALKKGDSGAWVTDSETQEVYGHIVASEAFGRAHVIPMNDIFSDIKTRLSLSAVGLASQDEIWSVLSIETGSDTCSTPLGLNADDGSSATSSKTFPNSTNPISALSADSKEQGEEGTRFRWDPEFPPALPYPRLPQSCSTLPTICHDNLEVDEGYVSQQPSRDSTSVTPPPLSGSTALAPFYPDTYPSTRHDGPLAPQTSRRYPATNAGQGAENRNLYQYSYRHPAYNVYPGAAHSYNHYTPGCNPYIPSFYHTAPSFGPSSLPKSGTDSGYASTNNSPNPGPHVSFPLTPYVSALSRMNPGSATHGTPP